MPKKAHWISLIQVLFVCILTVYTHCVSAQEYPLKIVTEHWPPYHYLNENGEIRGAAHDVVKQVITQSKLEANIDVLSWSKAYDIALHRPNTLIFSIVKTPERENLFDWYCPIAEPLEISMFKLRKDVKAIFRPSGDHAGLMSSAIGLFDKLR